MGNTKEICMGSSASKEQSAADMKGTAKSAISQPLTYNICCSTSNYITAVVTHPFHTTTRLMKKQTWHQIHPSRWDIYSATVVLLQCLMLSLFLGIPSTQVSMIHWHEVTYPSKNLATVTSRFALPLLLLPFGSPPLVIKQCLRINTVMTQILPTKLQAFLHAQVMGSAVIKTQVAWVGLYRSLCLSLLTSEGTSERRSQGLIDKPHTV